MQFTKGPRFPRTKIGEVFIHNDKAYRRGRGIYYAANYGAPIIDRAYRRRERKRRWKQEQEDRAKIDRLQLTFHRRMKEAQSNN